MWAVNCGHEGNTRRTRSRENSGPTGDERLTVVQMHITVTPAEEGGASEWRRTLGGSNSRPLSNIRGRISCLDWASAVSYRFSYCLFKFQLIFLIRGELYSVRAFMATADLKRSQDWRSSWECHGRIDGCPDPNYRTYLTICGCLTPATRNQLFMLMSYTVCPVE